MNEIDKIIEEVTAEHPYKERGNRDSYSQYNEGWSDACDILGERIKQALSLYNVSGFSADKVKQAYEDGQWDSEEGKGDKFNINNYR